MQDRFGKPLILGLHLKYTHVQWKRTTLQMRIVVAYQKLFKIVFLLFRTNAMFSHKNSNPVTLLHCNTWRNVILQIAYALIAIRAYTKRP